MIDTRWTQLRKILVGTGWVWRDNTLFSPHETMWFTATANPDHASFRDRMTRAMHATDDEPAIDTDPDRYALHQDLVSLVAALDAVLDGN